MKLSEKNFRKINKLLSEIQEEVAICGNKELMESVISEDMDHKITYLVDDSMKNTYLMDYYVIDMEMLFDLQIRHLIIVDEIQKASEMFENIRKECRYNNIIVYNIYGIPMESCYQKSIRENIRYTGMTGQNLRAAIDKCDVVTFDIGNTLFFQRYMYFSDFFRNIGKKLNEKGINVFDFMQSVDNIKHRDSFSNIRVIIEVMIQEKNLPDDYLEKIWELVIEQVKEAFIPRKEVVEALKYAKEKGKKVCLIEDMPEYRLPKIVWQNLLQTYEIGQCDEIICSGDYWLHKDQGLYEKVIERFGDDKKFLCVGDEQIADVYIPSNYGMDTFLIKAPMEMLKGLDEIVLEQLENNIVRDMIENYLINVYCNLYTVSEIRQELEKEDTKRYRNEIQEQIEFWKNCNSVMECEPIKYKPLLVNNKGEYTKIEFNSADNPQVSIVIPVYNQFDYTYNCLQAIYNNSGSISYEIIVADDCSTDNVKVLEDYVSGITVIHNDTNLKFLRNCNNAAHYAKGKYILFLNNDTQVQPDWLEPLVRLMETDEKIGMVGSKLVYPNGQLQEAGGILWKDGSAWNYGHLMNPESSEYCYVKEVDYISGASVMIKRTLWEEIGGFDERFAPAYYEDTDLAFEVRKHGYKVCFQPESVVVHFEGVTNGKDLASGMKSYQMKNHETFYEKWKNVLIKEHFENGEEVFLAKDRGQMKKRILVVDHYVPNYDKDAGGRCTYMYLKMFLRLGLQVTFIGDNFAKPEPYTTELLQMGIQVLYGDFYYLHWQDWLKLNLKYFDFVYLQRPHISIKYMDLVKKYSHAKVFYFAHDLHYIRTYRDYLVSGKKEALEESEHWKPIELELFDKTDVGHVVGSYEQEIIQKEFPDKPIRNIPLYIYDDEPCGIEKDFSKRKDILFVGGFTHKPNIDAVLWFAKEIFPQLLKKYPELVWHIVGSGAPEEVKALASDHIILEGFVTDEELGELYRKCRLVVVPLRYGAGVKGKIVESAYYQIPVVTTAIGGEGLDASVGSFVMEDDADKMAQLIESLYTDYDELRKMSDAGETMIQKYFTSKAAESVLLADMKL